MPDSFFTEKEEGSKPSSAAAEIKPISKIGYRQEDAIVSAEDLTILLNTAWHNRSPKKI